MGGSVTYCFDNVVDKLFGLVHLFLGVGHDQAMQVLLLVAGVCCIRTAFAFLDGALSADSNLGTGF